MKIKHEKTEINDDHKSPKTYCLSGRLETLTKNTRQTLH